MRTIQMTVPAMETAAERQNRVTELSSIEQLNHKCLRAVLARVSIVCKSGNVNFTRRSLIDREMAPNVHEKASCPRRARHRSRCAGFRPAGAERRAASAIHGSSGRNLLLWAPPQRPPGLPVGRREV